MAVIKTPAGTYAAIVNYRDEAGNRKQIKRLAPTRADAKKLEAEIIRKRDDGGDLRTGRGPTATFLDEWVDKRPGIRSTTRARYREAIRKISRELGHIPLARLTARDVNRLYDSLRGDGLSEKSILIVHRVLKEAISSAVKLGYVMRNVCDLVDSPSAEPFEYYVATSEEIARVFAVADETPIGPIVRFAALTGMRAGEVVALKWQNVGDDGTVTVMESLTTTGETLPPKTRKRRGQRIALSPNTVDLLQALPRTSPYVFAPPDADHWTQSRVRHHWHAVRDKAGVPRLRFHDLRHAHGSHLIAAGFPITDVAERLGHAQVSTTLNYYSHALPGRDAHVAAAADGLYLNNGEPLTVRPNAAVVVPRQSFDFETVGMRRKRERKPQNLNKRPPPLPGRVRMIGVRDVAGHKAICDAKGCKRNASQAHPNVAANVCSFHASRPVVLKTYFAKTEGVGILAPRD